MGPHLLRIKQWNWESCTYSSSVGTTFTILQLNSRGQNVTRIIEEILIVVRDMVTIVYKGWIDPLKQGDVIYIA